MDLYGLVGKVISYKLYEEMSFRQGVALRVKQEDRSTRTGLVKLDHIGIEILGTANPQNIEACGQEYVVTHFMFDVDKSTIQELPLSDQIVWKLQYE